jgi:hypothetical protein
MIYAFDLTIRAIIPSYMQPVAELMAKFNNVVFLNYNEFQIFTDYLKKSLERSNPEGSTAFVEVYNSFYEEDAGGIYVYSHRDSGDCLLRMRFSPAHSIMEYDLNSCKFNDISNRLKEGGTQ